MGTFGDYATVSGSTFSFTDNSIAVITDRYDHEYYKVEYKVPCSQSGWIFRHLGRLLIHGTAMDNSYSHSLGYLCMDEE